MSPKYNRALIHLCLGLILFIAAYLAGGGR
jgi:hypothetical protein